MAFFLPSRCQCSMDKLAHVHHLNPCSVPYRRTKWAPRSHSRASISQGMIDTSNIASAQFSSPKFSSSFHLLENMVQIRTLESVRVLHAQILKMPYEGNLHAMDKSLIRYYLEFGGFMCATKVFFVGFTRNYLLWNSFVEECESFGGDPLEIMEAFKELHNIGVQLNSRALTVVLKICSALMDLWLGLEIHASVIKRGLDFDVHLNCALINFYGKCWNVDKANQVFDETPHHENFLWNTIIIVNLRSERWGEALALFNRMQLSSAKPTCGTMVKLLQASGKLRALNEGKQIHGYVLRCGLESNVSICNSLISMYSRNNELKLARTVFYSMENHNISSWNSIISSHAVTGSLNDVWDIFRKMESLTIKPDIITWNSLLSAHLLQGSYNTVLTIFRRLQSGGFKPDSCSVTSAIQAIIELGFFTLGKEIHGYVIRNKLDYDVYVCTSLVDMYVKNDSLEKAQALFDNAETKNICSWNSLISGYSFKGQFNNAETLLTQMKEEGIEPDLVTWNSLVSGYSMCGHSDKALAVVHRIKSSGLTPNVVSWTAIISGCSQNENYRDALKFFSQMQAENVKPNSTTICSLLSACAGLSFLKKGEEIHCLSIRLVLDDIYAATALIDMYSKAGRLKVAIDIFSRIQNKTRPCWNCMMMGYAIYGHGEEVMTLFDELCKTGIQPDSITFTALLSGCKNSGLIDEGWKCFDSMKTDYNLNPTIEHYSCMVDLLGKAGYLDEAWDFIQTMPIKPDASIWGALLASCRIYNNMKLAEVAAKNLFELEPQNSSNYVLMMNLYSALNHWEDVERLKESMIARGLKIPHVWSWTQVNQTIHLFSTEGKPHPEEGDIYFELYHLISEIRKLGYVPDIKCVYQNIDDNEKQKVLLSHTEKLAITYALMKSKGGAPIRVVKNTRICQDCHAAAKYISLAKNRSIFLRDGGRFHHFVNGKCSCNDRW
ncbi:LOW QUALITY PROTEIN: pentatricopeptide repeat-containing protein At4g01030, mitochondrial [Prosopis cineraria]|uniref:LOW QUALITY PROTEIN: pentatricopeptide repeat-containing protein At4g01030, mitochondrial n=1 Tax=Prosopis cineraria TaxID=364024 RepID=UPI00240F7B5F|nr:LOW QUALITY PROTEIN: pentatricopeptide repeat-containing protein At4g01030, mitochondrial [Prosopis cineraria]